MANYNPANNGDPLHSSNDGNAVISQGSAVVAANLATIDRVRPCRIAAGTLVHRVVVRNPDLDSGATLAVNIGFAPIDGTAGNATAVAAAATTWQAAATTTYELMPPVLVAKDSYLEAVPTVAGVGTGTVHAKVEGEGKGAK